MELGLGLGPFRQSKSCRPHREIKKADVSQEMVLWNPSLSANQTTTASSSFTSATATSVNSFVEYPFTLAASSSYCVQLSTPTSSSELYDKMLVDLLSMLTI